MVGAAATAIGFYATVAGTVAAAPTTAIASVARTFSALRNTADASYVAGSDAAAGLAAAAVVVGAGAIGRRAATASGIAAALIDVAAACASAAAAIARSDTAPPQLRHLIWFSRCRGASRPAQTWWPHGFLTRRSARLGRAGSPRAYLREPLAIRLAMLPWSTVVVKAARVMGASSGCGHAPGTEAAKALGRPLPQQEAMLPLALPLRPGPVEDRGRLAPPPPTPAADPKRLERMKKVSFQVWGCPRVMPFARGLRRA